MGRRGGDPYPMLAKHKRKGYPKQRFVPRSEEREAQMGLPSLGIPNWKDKPLEYVALKN